MEATSRHVSGAGGLALHLLEWSQHGVPMLLVHGFGNEAHIWDDFAPEVASHYRVLALDQRGHGDSEWDPEQRYDYDDYVADLEAVVEAEGIDRLVLIGHSLGGRASTLFAGQHPERMAGLVIVDAGPELDRRGTLRIQLDVGANRDPSFATLAEFENMLAHSYPAATPTAIKRMAKFGVKPRADGRFIFKMDPGLRGAVGGRPDPEEMARREDQTRTALWDALRKIACPTLVVRGAASDILSPEVADRMVDETLPNGKLAIVPQAGHSVMTDNPPGFRDAVCAFVLGEG